MQKDIKIALGAAGVCVCSARDERMNSLADGDICRARKQVLLFNEYRMHLSAEA